MTSLWGVQLAVARGLALTRHSSITVPQAYFKGNCQATRKTSEKAQSTAVQDQKGETANKGRTGDTGIVTSLSIQEEKTPMWKGIKSRRRKVSRRQTATQQQWRPVSGRSDGWSSSTSFTAAWPAKTLQVSCLGQDAHRWLALELIKSFLSFTFANR